MLLAKLCIEGRGFASGCLQLLVAPKDLLFVRVDSASEIRLSSGGGCLLPALLDRGQIRSTGTLRLEVPHSLIGSGERSLGELEPLF